MSRAAAWLVGGVLVAGASGCVSQQQLAQQDRQTRQLIQEDRRQLQMVQRQVDRLQRAIEERGGTAGAQASSDRMTEIEKRIAVLEGHRAGRAPSDEPLPDTVDLGNAPEPAAPREPSSSPPPVVATAPPTPPPTTPPPPPPPVEDAWTKDVQRDRAAAGASSAPEKTEYLAAMESVERKDCPRAVGQLNAFAAKSKDSPLAGNALYWAGRCYQARGDSKQAISKFYEVGTRYPKSGKAPAALWEQGNLFLRMGNSGDARLVLAEIIRKYPSSDEATRARQKLSELER